MKGNAAYYNYALSVNGRTEKHGKVYETDYLPDVLTTRTIAMMNEPSASPFFAILSLPSPHSPYEPAPQHAAMFENLKAPRTPNYDKFTSDKNTFVRDAT
jgi:N-acetylglucosamine-6-sulfatase